MNVRTIAAAQTCSLSAVASIVHDLRNPLATIHGGAEMLVHSKLSPPQIHRVARNVYSASIRIRELLEEFLYRSSGSKDEKELCDVRDLVTCAVDRVAASAELQSVEIVQEVPAGLTVALDWYRIHRVLVNLLVNALDAMPHGGTVHVSAEPDRDSVLIQVRDTGPGIAPQIWDRLFEPFATAGKPHGIGLGLATSRQAVLDHGGEMWAKSSNRGACFSFLLPAAIPQETGSR